MIENKKFGDDKQIVFMWGLALGILLMFGLMTLGSYFR